MNEEQEAKAKRISRRRIHNFISWFLIWPITFVISFFAFWIIVLCTILNIYMLTDDNIEVVVTICSVVIVLSGITASQISKRYRQAMNSAEEN